ncbi:alpha/beta fold hydrolase [Legionella jamestowniensis]|uniref:L-serine/homoserine O-acetyltransferase n=1 Tax=Legionella jamestowniensis TaxID=455 RepID=A0A0W0UZ98_9GAMM|nr:alpha/beta fold hydrolase [Legionella jamestowniensis]KTD13216.1 L-serine/homoserine O-acetyltransferase [Legionella jamestowniensis]SFL78577.1 homoserine O-acetyltransferase [Legionella jamestowniensis DSM 19215]
MNCSTQQINLPDFKISSGETLVEPKATFTIYGDFTISKPCALIFHGFSSSSELHSWWEKFNFSEMVRHFNIICINSLSSSHGTTGPESMNPKTQKPYFDTFPEVTIQDTVDFAMHTLMHLEINHLDLVLGCSLGGMQALDMYLRYPEIAKKYISVAGVPVPYMTKLTNLAQAMLIDNARHSGSKEELESALGFSRFFFRLSCTNEKALTFLEQKCQIDKSFSSSLLDYFIQDNKRFQKEFSPYSNSIILKMIANFKLDIREPDVKFKSELTIVSIADDIFTPEENVKLTYENLLKQKHNVAYRHFMTDFGHEAWIVDGKRFYEFIKSDLYS